MFFDDGEYRLFWGMGLLKIEEISTARFPDANSMMLDSYIHITFFAILVLLVRFDVDVNVGHIAV